MARRLIAGGRLGVEFTGGKVSPVSPKYVASRYGAGRTLDKGVGGPWILATRFWRDIGVWSDNAVWRD